MSWREHLRPAVFDLIALPAVRLHLGPVRARPARRQRGGLSPRGGGAERFPGGAGPRPVPPLPGGLGEAAPRGAGAALERRAGAAPARQWLGRDHLHPPHRLRRRPRGPAGEGALPVADLRRVRGDRARPRRGAAAGPARRSLPARRAGAGRGHPPRASGARLLRLAQQPHRQPLRRGGDGAARARHGGGLRGGRGLRRLRRRDPGVEGGRGAGPVRHALALQRSGSPRSGWARWSVRPMPSPSSTRCGSPTT